MEIRALRGARPRGEFGALIGVTGLTVYRWELPDGSPEARRPRGKVLARLRAFMAEIAAQTESPKPALSTAAPATPPLSSDELAALAPALAAMDECRLDRSELELVALLSRGALRSEAARAFATIMLARLQLLARHDTKSAGAALLGAATEVQRLPPAVQLEHHLTAALLHACSDAHVFNPGRTNHHAALAQALSNEARGDHRFLLWYAQFIAAVSLFEAPLIARAMESFPAARALATTPLHRCLAEEAATIASLGTGRPAEAAGRIDAFHALTAEAGLPLQQVRALGWRADIAVEQAAPPEEILALLDRAEQLQQRHRIAEGIHTMMARRNRGETLLRLGRLREAEEALLDAARVARDIAYTPLRIFTTIARLYLLTDRTDDLARLSQEALGAEDAQRELTRAFGRIGVLLCDLQRGDAAADWCDRLLERLADLQRLGAWPVAYRHLVVTSLAVAATKGGATHAERLLHLADRAVELSPSPAASAAYRRLRATILLRRGRFVEARQSLQAALATFEAAADRIESALVRRALASADVMEKVAGAAGRLRETEEELAGLGLAVPPVVRSDTAYEEAALSSTSSVTPGERLPVNLLLVPCQRLSTRGVGAAFLQKELVSIAGELLPGRSVRLERIDPTGVATTLERVDGAADESLAWFELGDGPGTRLRLGIGGALDGSQRAGLEVLVSTAALAFEIAALRGLSVAPAARDPQALPTPGRIAVPGLVAASPVMRRLESELGRLSGSRATIIIHGESGTGKEVVARAIHDLSRRASGPYVTFNSAAVPRELFEGQLFGYRKGAFTGATADHPGTIRAADGGTLFLDEIGELPLDVQPKLLRFLENGEILPLGERKPAQVDVRVIAATHRDLRRLVGEGKFREDLYYRLQVIPVVIPPLRERREDIIALARHFIRKLTPDGAPPPVLTPDGEARLLAHPWPGNVRELRNVIERCLAFDPVPRLLGAAEIRL